jgi:predicted DsbA family dithiol-disulfide isomerase
MNELLAKKIGMSVEQAKEMNDNIVRQAAEVGLIYNFDNMQPTNTFDAHRLAQFATKHHKGNEMTERLLKAYFTDSEHIGDHNTLIKLAVEVGLDQEEVEILLQTCKYTKGVRLDEEQAQEMGVQGVPFFVFNEKYAVSGAQSPEVFVEVLEKVWEEENKQPALQSLQPKYTEGTYCCDDESCSGIKTE